MQKTPFTIAADRAAAQGHKTLAERIRIEGRVARKVVEAILAAGMTVGVNDGEETVLRHSTSLDDAMQALFSTDEDFIIAYNAETGKMFGKVYMVWGNDGWDAINDYSTSLEDVLAGVNQYCDLAAA